MKNKPVKHLLFFLLLTSSTIGLSQNNNELYKRLAQAGKNEYATIFTQMSKNAQTFSPRQSLAYAITAERFAKENKKDKWQALTAQTEAYLLLGKYKTAIETAEEALSINDKKDAENQNKLYCLIGQAHKELGEFDKAKTYYEKALLFSQKTNNTTLTAQILQWIGSLMLRQNKITDAQNFYNQSFTINSSNNDSNAMAANLTAQALLFRQKGEYTEALNYIEKGLQITKNQSNETKSGLLNLRGSIFFLQRKYDNALSDFEAALNLRRRTGNAADISTTLLNISNIYRETNQYQKGIEKLNQALFFRLLQADTSQIISLYNSIGGFNLRFNLYDKALLNYLRALQLSYHNEYSNELGPLLMNIGTLYYELNDTKKADEYLNKAIEILVLPRDKSKLALLYTHLGNNSRKALNYKNAIEYYQKALAEKYQLNDKSGTASVLLNMGAAYQEWKKYDLALTYTHKALNSQKELKNTQGEATTLNQLGNIYNDQNQKAEALLYFKLTRKLAATNNFLYLEALSSRKEAEIELQNNHLEQANTLINKSIEIGHRINNTELIRKGQLALYEYYTRQNDYKSALSAYKIYAQYTDTLNRQQNQKQIIQMQMNFEIARRDSRINEAEVKIEQLNKEQEKRNYELRVQRNLQYLWLAIIILLLISAISLIRGYRLKKKAAVLLEEKFEISEDSNKKLRKSEEELRTLNNTKDKFFSIIAHDLKNPLGGLVSLTELMTSNYEQLEDENKKEIVLLINQSSKQLNTLLENLLHWSRVQLGKMPFRPENLNIHNKISECFDLQKINASEKNIDLINQSTTTDMAWADTDMISLVLRNLVSNAIKFTPRGGSVTVSTRKNDNNTLEISVSDTGRGLTPEEKAKLFRLDVNFTTSGTDNEPGTGLGLILCKECIEHHGGTIRVESVYEKGSQFIFTLNITKNV